MSAFTPFQPLVQKGAAGFGQTSTITTTSQTIQVTASVGAATNGLMVEAFNPTPLYIAASTNALSSPLALQAYVRISLEASTSIAATNADYCMLVPPQQTVVRLFATPQGAYNVAVFCSVSPTTAGAVMTFYPGQGGTV